MKEIDYKVLNLISEKVKKEYIRKDLNLKHKEINNIYKKLKELELIKIKGVGWIILDWYADDYKSYVWRFMTLTEKWYNLLTKNKGNE